jgi:hypothetical protein
MPTSDLDEVPSGPTDVSSWNGSGATMALPLLGEAGSARNRQPWLLVGAAGIGAAVSLSLGVYGRAHHATGKAITTFGFDSMLPMKAWFTTVAAVLALVQLASALAMWGRLPLGKGSPA